MYLLSIQEQRLLLKLQQPFVIKGKPVMQEMYINGEKRLWDKGEEIPEGITEG